MNSFNLVSEPWIPCLFVNERNTRLLTLREVFQQSSSIREINDASPLVTVALHRLLLAILHRNFGPENPVAWHALWIAPSLPLAKLESYWDQWSERFDLFHSEHPFYQSRSLPQEPKYWKPVAKLTHELATGNNDTLFDHSYETSGLTFSCAQAARYIVAQQLFALGGTQTREPGDSPSADAAPLSKDALATVKGSDLRQTLLLNLHQYKPSDELPFPVTGHDAPCWELGKEPEAGDSIPSGYLDLLTWQSRRIRLIPTSALDGSTVVEKVVIMKGRQTPEDWSLRGRETMIAFRANLNAKPGQDPWPAVGFQQEKAVWRDSAALLQAASGTHARPKNMDWLSRLVQKGYLERKTILPLDLCGVSTDRAKILFWRHERLPIPLRLLEDPVLLDVLDLSLDKAEKVASILRRSANKLAELVL